MARVGLVYSQQTAWYYGGEQAAAKVENYGLGWYQALVESRIPFEMMHDQLLDAERLAPYRTLIPRYPDLPMEKVYPRTPKTDISCLYLRQSGGRVAYFPFDIDRTFWEVLCEDHLKVLRNTVRWANHEEPIIEVDGPGLLDITMWRNAGSLTIHLVNLTNPMAMKGPYRDFFPVGAQVVKLRLPASIHPKQARSLVTDKSVAMARTGSVMSLSVPSILDHEVLALDL